MTTLAQAKADDVVVMAGKGHETYQIIGHQSVDYDERKVVQQFMQQAAGGSI